MTMDKSVAILGFHDSSAGQIDRWYEERTGYKIACFILEEATFGIDVASENKKRVSQRTEFPQKGLFRNKPFLVSMHWIEELKRMGIGKVLPLTPDNYQRKRQIDLCEQNGIELVSAIHPTVTILDEVRIEPGVWINAKAVIGFKAEIARGVIINTGAQVEHHNVLEECSQVDPGVVMAGYVTLRRYAHVHTNATIINRREIGEGAIVGAGAVVIKDIPPRCTAVGVPAKVIKYHETHV